MTKGAETRSLNLGKINDGCIALFGGIYSNYLALEKACNDAKGRGATTLFCLGDMGAFGPHPDRVFPLLKQNQVICVQGNYDDSVGNGREDCQCGYLDERDNRFAQISYDYTLAKTNAENRAWLRELPTEIRYLWNGKRVLLCHGSPRRTNEFLWESTSSMAFLEYLANEYQADIVACTHTGLHWERKLTGGNRFINVGALGRPANDGQTCVWYALLSIQSGDLKLEFVPVAYEHEQLACEMEAEGLPAEFIETVRKGWWTSCLEVLPGRERKQGKF